MLKNEILFCSNSTKAQAKPANLMLVEPKTSGKGSWRVSKAHIFIVIKPLS
jgi:hypothetical protein